MKGNMNSVLFQKKKIKLLLVIACTPLFTYSMQHTNIDAMKDKILSFAQTQQERDQARAILQKVKNLDDLNKLLKKSGASAHHATYAESRNFDYPHQGD